MTAFALNNKVQINAPSLTTNNQGGVSGWKTAKYAPGFAASGKQFYDGLLGRHRQSG